MSWVKHIERNGGLGKRGMCPGQTNLNARVYWGMHIEQKACMACMRGCVCIGECGNGGKAGEGERGFLQYLPPSHEGGDSMCVTSSTCPS